MTTTFVYHYRATADDGQELRYSLRGLDKFYLDDATIWIVGDTPPSWAQNIFHVPSEQVPGDDQKCRNTLMNMLKVARVLQKIGRDRAVYLDDDHVLLDYTDEVLLTYRATWLNHWRFLSGRKEADVQWLVRAGRNTHRVLDHAGRLDTALSYDLHRPIPFIVDEMVRVLDHFEGVSADLAPLWRTVYGNFAKHDYPAVYARDVRADAHVQPGSKWASTDERFFARSKRFIDAQLPARSRWEAR